MRCYRWDHEGGTTYVAGKTEEKAALWLPPDATGLVEVSPEEMASIPVQDGLPYLAILLGSTLLEKFQFRSRDGIGGILYEEKR